MSTQVINKLDDFLGGESILPPISPASPMFPRDTDPIEPYLESWTNIGFMMYDLIYSLRLRPILKSQTPSAEIFNSMENKVCSNAFYEGGAIEIFNRQRQYYSVAVSILLLHDYLLTLQGEVSEFPAMALDYVLTRDPGPICVGRK